MSSKIEKKEGNIVTVKYEVESDRFNKAVQKTYNKERSKFNIPGFRKGKAPRKIIELNYGKGIFYEGAVNIIFPEIYEEVIKEHSLEPVDRPSLDIGDIEDGKSVEFTLDITVKPEVELGNYKGLEVSKVEYSVEDEAIETELKRIQDTNARLISMEDRGVKNGDVITLDYSGSVEGVDFAGGTAENQTLEVGLGKFIPGFEEQLVGKNLGEEAIIKVKFPETYYSEELADKEAEFAVKIKEIKEKEVPVLDDEFAKDVSEFDTLEELKSDIKAKMTKQKEEDSQNEIENKLIDLICEDSKIDIPEAMVESQIDSSVNDFAYRLRYQGLDIQKYLEANKMSMEDFRKQFRTNSEKLVRSELILEAISKAENIVVEESDMNKELEDLAKSYNKGVNEFKEKLSEEDMEYIKLGLIKKKALDFIVENAKLV